MTRYNTITKLLALILSIALAFGAMPGAAFAEGGGTDDTSGEYETVTDVTATSPSAITVTLFAEPAFTIPEDALYIDAGEAVTEDDLLNGVSAKTENGEVEVTVEDTDGLDMDDPQPQFEENPEDGIVNKPYIITYAAGEETAARECYVTAPVMKPAGGVSDFNGLQDAADGGNEGFFPLENANVTEQQEPDLSVTLTGGGEPELNVDYSRADGRLTILSGKPMTIGMTTPGSSTTKEFIVVDMTDDSVTADVTLDGVNIHKTDAAEPIHPIYILGDAWITLEGDSEVTNDNNSGMALASYASLIITEESTGSLTANGGGDNKCGIGIGNDAELIMNGGVLTANGGNLGAGIGESNPSGFYGALTVNGGIVSAEGGGRGAGIGTSNNASFGTRGAVTINGGIVTAKGGGAGIGTVNSFAGTVTINGGTVTAEGSGSAADIGSASSGPHGGTITINGGSVNADTVTIENSTDYPKNSGGAKVYLNALTVSNPTVTGEQIAAGNLDGTAMAETADASANVYGVNDVYTDEDGKLYFWLPENNAADARVSVTANDNTYGKTYARNIDTQTQTLLLSPAAPAKPELASATATSVTLRKPDSVSGAVEYRKGEIGTWETNQLFSGLTPDTQYTFFMRIAETANMNEASPASQGLSVTTNKAVLTGTVTISGEAKYGAALKAAGIDGLTSNPVIDSIGVLSYQWKRGGEEINAANSAEYTLTQADIGKNITVTVTAANCEGGVTSGPTGPIEKAGAPDAPIPPELASKTANSVTLRKPASVSGDVQYRQGETGTWLTEAEFYDLTPNTTYSFYMRLAATATHEASAESPALPVITDKAALKGTVTVSGSAKYGETLTADTTGLAADPGGADTLGTLSYEWNRNGAAISGANSASYTLTEDDIGKQITVTVTAAA